MLALVYREKRKAIEGRSTGEREDIASSGG